MEKSRMEACSNKRLGYGVRGNAACPSRASGPHDGVGLELRYRPNRWGSKSTRFRGPNVVSCEIVRNVSDVGPEWGVATVKDEFLVVVMVLRL